MGWLRPTNQWRRFCSGLTNSTSIATVIQPDTHAYAAHYAGFVQDDWKLSSRLTLNFGLRYEYHPMFRDHLNNTTNFLPDYTSTVDGQVVNGAVVIPNQAAFSILNPNFAKSIYLTANSDISASRHPREPARFAKEPTLRHGSDSRGNRFPTVARSSAAVMAGSLKR